VIRVLNETLAHRRLLLATCV